MHWAAERSLGLISLKKTDSYIYIATERLVPLRWHVKRKSLSPETAKWGLYSIAVRPVQHGGILKTLGSG